jgi:outer membrane biosynthesis protein TonB
MRAIRMAIVSVLLATAGNLGAQVPVEPGKSESVLTMRVDGELSIDPDGRVMDYRITTKLDPQVEKLVRRAVPAWRFKPILVDDTPAIATSPMRITLAAEEMAQGFRVTVDNVVFRPNTEQEYQAELASKKAHRRISVAGEAPAPLVWITSKRLQPPMYPPGLQKSGVEGIVLLTLRLNPDGTVAEVFAGQSSLLNVKGSSALLDRARTMLERSAGDVAKRWTFQVDAEDPATLTPEHLTVRVPVEYSLGRRGNGPDALAGKWRHEFRGPNLTAPWLPDENASKIGVSDLNGNEMLAGVSPFELSDRSVIGKAL